jgi:hypothetical protein
MWDQRILLATIRGGISATPDHIAVLRPVAKGM